VEKRQAGSGVGVAVEIDCVDGVEGIDEGDMLVEDALVGDGVGAVGVALVGEGDGSMGVDDG
jgi:hypothetical protein